MQYCPAKASKILRNDRHCPAYTNTMVGKYAYFVLNNLTNEGVFDYFRDTAVKLNTLPANGAYIYHKIFSFMMSYLAISMGDRFCLRKKGQDRGRWVGAPKSASSMTMSELGHEKPWLEHGRPFLLF